MKEFIYSLFENKKQKLVWVVYVIFIVFLVYVVTDLNYTERSCLNQGHGCLSLIKYTTVFTLVFIVIALILRNRQRGKDNSQN